jgi:hypothetical protein
MENTHHKGSELKNVTDTWAENERILREENQLKEEIKIPDEAPSGDELENIVRMESNEYDHSNKEDRLLGGERATMNDDDDNSEQ